MTSSLMSSKPEMVAKGVAIVTNMAQIVKSTTELAAIYRLSEDDVPGASLSGKSPDVLNVEQLKRWLACRGARRSGKKADLVQR